MEEENLRDRYIINRVKEENHFTSVCVCVFYRCLLFLLFHCIVVTFDYIILKDFQFDQREKQISSFCFFSDISLFIIIIVKYLT